MKMKRFRKVLTTRPGASVEESRPMVKGVGRMRGRSFLAVAAGIVTLVTSCTAAAHDGLSRTSSPNTVTSQITTSTAGSPIPSKTQELPPKKLAASWPESEKLIASFANKTDDISAGPYSTSTGFVAVYIRCVGTGKIDVMIPGSAGYSLDCSRDDSSLGIRNASQIQTPNGFKVDVKCPNIWSMAITEIRKPVIDINTTTRP